MNTTEYIYALENISSRKKQQLSDVLEGICNAAKAIAKDLRYAQLRDILGAQESVNVQGEEQQKLDVIANNRLKHHLSLVSSVYAIASEEEDHSVVFQENISKDEGYIVAFDPLDGSSNIDVNIPVGTIFSVLSVQGGAPISDESFLQKGDQQRMAGYVMYGASTLLVITLGEGTHIFTLDENEEFVLSQRSVSIPEEGTIYSINEGNTHLLEQRYLDYIAHCKTLREDGKRSHTTRFIGALLSDFHRNMLKGGIFIYPSTTDHPTGKLRLIYECNPIAWLAEQAHGKAIDGTRRILNILPSSLHQRVPFVTGSSLKVDAVQQMIGA